MTDACVAVPQPPGQRLQVRLGSGGDQADRQLDTGPLCPAQLSQCSAGTEGQQWSVTWNKFESQLFEDFHIFILDIVNCKQTGMQKKQIDTNKK